MEGEEGELERMKMLGTGELLKEWGGDMVGVSEKE